MLAESFIKIGKKNISDVVITWVNTETTTIIIAQAIKSIKGVLIIKWSL